MVLPQPKLHQVVGDTIRPYDLMQSQLGNQALLEKLAGLAILDGNLIEDAELDYTTTNLVEHKLGRKYRGFIVVRRQVPPCGFHANTPADTSIAASAWEDLTHGTDVYDLGSNHAAGIFTAPTDGFYGFQTSLLYATAMADGRNAAIRLLQNNTTVVANGIESVGASTDPAVVAWTRVKMARGDTMRSQAYHTNSTDPSTVSTSALYTWWKGWLVDEGISEDKDWLDTATNDPTKFLPLRCSFDQTVSLWVF